jgi:hypothetical protein
LTNTPGTVVWQEPSAATVQAQPNAGYLLTNTQIVTLTLPASPSIGSVVQVAGVGGGGWILAQNAAQYISGSFIPVWSAIGAPNESWSSIATSSDGTKLAAVVEGGGIYTSVNSGIKWTQQIPAPYEVWSSIASSSDGTHLAAVDDFGDIYTSINFGTNWTLQTNVLAAQEEGGFTAIVSSSDGTMLALVFNGGGIYTSSNSGTNWTQQSGTSLPFSSSATTIGTAGFLQGAAGTSIQLIYVGGGKFAVFSQQGTIYDH